MCDNLNLNEMEYWSMGEYLKRLCTYNYDERERVLLGSGKYNGYEWFIVSYCTHPCAYIVVDEYTYGYKLYDFEIDQLDVHGGITYSDWGLHEWVDKNKWVIGWDYNHIGDYSPFSLGVYGVKYTTEEIYEDVEDVINQLRSL